MPKKKLLLNYSGVKRAFGTKIELKLSSAIKKKLNANSGMPQTPKFRFNSRVLKMLKRQVTRNRNSAITSVDQSLNSTIDESRNLKQKLNTKRVSIADLNL